MLEKILLDPAAKQKDLITYENSIFEFGEE
jgi:hypothetical protein